MFSREEAQLSSIVGKELSTCSMLLRAIRAYVLIMVIFLFKISDEDWLKKTNCKIPLHTPQSVKGSFQFQPPTQVKVTGSFLHETCVKPNIHIDLMVEMPQVGAISILIYLFVYKWVLPADMIQ